MWWWNEERGHGGRIVFSALLIKFSKHLALLVCLLILGRASGRYPITELSIFGLTVLAAMVHFCGRSLSRGSRPASSLQGRHDP